MKLKQLVTLTTLLSLNFCPNITLANVYLKHNIPYPNLTDGKVLGLTSNHSHKLLFYTGKKDGKNINGYYRSSHFLDWTSHTFHPLELFQTDAKRLLAVTDGPANQTVVLSHIEGVGQLLSNSNDGKQWDTKRIVAPSLFFNNLTSANISGLHNVIAYGSTHSSYLTSSDNSHWYAWSLPNSCKNSECTIENKYLGDDGANKLVLIQTAKSFYDTNTLYYSTNLHDWYVNNDVPFNHEKIEHVFKSSYGLTTVSTFDKNNNHKLWLSDDLSNWKSFDLPNNAKLADLTVANKRIEMLLITKGEFETFTDHSYLDPETNSVHLLSQYKGEVSKIKYLDDKLYLIGNFIDTDNTNNTNSSILVEG